MNDTIAAIATPAGAGGIGVVRVSGPDAVAVLARLVGREPEALGDRRVVQAVARDPRSGERLDQVLCLVMRGPRSFTGEDVAEVHGHGGVVNMRRILAGALAAGARAAEPGEFTRRAFEHGRIDLTRAEAILGVIEATSERGLRLAQAQLAGRLGQRVEELRRGATELLAELEAGIDFPEQEVEVAGRAQLGRRAGALAAGCRALSDSYARGRALTSGISVALCGEVNAGKSSLFNRLVGRERALVAEEPGTTRDFVEAQMVWDGVAVTLIDTAGQRARAGQLERRGIELGLARAAEADVEVWLVPADAAAASSRVAPAVAVAGGTASVEAPSVAGSAARAADSPRAAAAPDGEVAPAAHRRLVVVSKGDVLDGADDGIAPLVTSAVTGQGLDALRAAVVAMAAGAARAGEGDEVALTSERQRDLIERAERALSRAARAGESGNPEELLAFDVREAVNALAQVLGQEVGDQVLDTLFARFCIGK